MSELKSGDYVRVWLHRDGMHYTGAPADVVAGSCPKGGGCRTGPLRRVRQTRGTVIASGAC